MVAEGVGDGITVRESWTAYSERAPEIQTDVGGFVAAEKEIVPLRISAARSEIQHIRTPKSLEPLADEACN